jgi:tetratricopeptide (TPR) repeat protein
MKKIFFLILALYPVIYCFSQTSDEFVKKGVEKIDLKDYKGALKDFTRGVMKDLLNDPNGAMEDYNKCIELGSNTAIVYLKRGSLKVKLKDFKGALSDYNECIALEPTLDVLRSFLLLPFFRLPVSRSS